MANVLVEEQYLQDIADSIRDKNGTNNTYTPAEMSSAIDDIQVGGGQSEFSTPEVSNNTLIFPSAYIKADIEYSGLRSFGKILIIS